MAQRRSFAWFVACRIWFVRSVRCLSVSFTLTLFHAVFETIVRCDFQCSSSFEASDLFLELHLSYFSQLLNSNKLKIDPTNFRILFSVDFHIVCTSIRIVSYLVSRSEFSLAFYYSRALWAEWIVAGWVEHPFILLDDFSILPRLHAESATNKWNAIGK